MGYYIRKLRWKKSAPQWKVQFLSYKKKDFPDSKAKKPKKEWDIPKERWRTLGFHSLMSIGEANARAKQLNAQEFIKHQEERIRKMELDRNHTLLLHQSVLPSEFVAEFELRFIRSRDSETIQGKRRTSRAQILWQAAEKLIIAVKIDPSEWFYSIHEIYDYFHQKQLSLRYIYAIIKIANLWGFFISRKLARPFLAIPLPRGYEKQRLLEAYYCKKRKARRPSQPLTPEILKQASSRMNRLNFNWLFLSVWFGLRPKEIDNLHHKDLWSTETLPNGRIVLWVYQTKIISLPPEDRWKPIPILFDEQRFALKIIESGKFRRPILRTVHKYFGPNIDLYGGRKGFSDLMLSMGHSFENISIWMGHSTLDRTWRSYKSKKKFHLP